MGTVDTSVQGTRVEAAEVGVRRELENRAEGEPKEAGRGGRRRGGSEATGALWNCQVQLSIS